MPVPDRTLLFYRDGLVGSISDTVLQEVPLWGKGEFFAVDSDGSRLEKRLRLYRERLAGLTMQELIDTAVAAGTMGCTRQNIQDLVRRGRIKPVMTLRNNFLFLRSELSRTDF